MPLLSAGNPREIDLQPLAAACPEISEGGVPRIVGIRLSPDGTLAAILLPSLEFDGPDQAWLYRVADGRLAAATVKANQKAWLAERDRRCGLETVTS